MQAPNEAEAHLLPLLDAIALLDRESARSEIGDRYQDVQAVARAIAAHLRTPEDQRPLRAFSAAVLEQPPCREKSQASRGRPTNPAGRVISRRTQTRVFEDLNRALVHRGARFVIDRTGKPREGADSLRFEPAVTASTDERPLGLEAAVVSLFREAPPLTFAGRTLGCQFFPDPNPFARGTPARYYDSTEKARRIRVSYDNRPSPVELPSVIRGVRELAQRGSPHERALASRVRLEGSKPCARLVAPPQIVRQKHFETLEIHCDRIHYAAAACAELGLDVVPVRDAKTISPVNAVGVRCAFTRELADGSKRTIFHKRKGGVTYPGAWDVGAAGYLDPRLDYDRDLSGLRPYLASKREGSEELGFDIDELPPDEDFWFFGLARNVRHGHLDILGECIISEEIEWRRESKHVDVIAEWPLSPRHAAEFIGARRPWVPGAILTVLLALHAWGFDVADIERHFRPVLEQDPFE